jgi:hypothetical protein
LTGWRCWSTVLRKTEVEIVEAKDVGKVSKTVKITKDLKAEGRDVKVIDMTKD